MKKHEGWHRPAHEGNGGLTTLRSNPGGSGAETLRDWPLPD